MPDTARTDKKENIEYELFKWFESKFPILIVILCFTAFSMGLALFVPKFTSCCGDMCPLINSNPILTESLNDRAGIVGSKTMSILSIVSCLTMIPATLYGQKKILKVSLFDWAVIFLLCTWIFKTTMLVNMLVGFHYGGCV